MAPRRRKRRPDDPLAAYRRVRKPMPPPARPEQDRRGRIGDDVARREAREAEAETGGDRAAGEGEPRNDREARG